MFSTTRAAAAPPLVSGLLRNHDRARRRLAAIASRMRLKPQTWLTAFLSFHQPLKSMGCEQLMYLSTSAHYEGESFMLGRSVPLELSPSCSINQRPRWICASTSLTHTQPSSGRMLAR